MLKVLVVVDKEKTAIDRLAQGNAKYNDNIDYKVIAVHPKRPDQKQLQEFEQEALEADIIDWQYFRTAEMLKAKYTWLKDKKQILTHHNPYSITESDWNSYDMVIANNKTIKNKLESITTSPLELVPNCVDADFWTFSREWEPNNTVIMVANRIESKKGILPVAIAAADLGMKFILVGSISDRDYFYSIMQTGPNVRFYEQISDEELRDLYHKSTIHVCNSIDNFESGTMPMIEAMLCGVPVLTREIGHVPELYNGENMVINKSDPEDVQALTNHLSFMTLNKDLMKDMREKAWNTAKKRDFERRAYIYQRLYRQVLFPDSTPVSIVVPIYDKPEVIIKCLNAIAKQTYKNIEVIVADDNEESNVSGVNRNLVKDFAKYVNFPVRYILTATDFDHQDYGLARARNEATIEATGDIIVYCDQRMVMSENAVENFVANIKPKTWLYGKKGAKKEFVENFSCIYRKEIIEAGLFNERINRYGGQSQELRNRVRTQGIQIQYVEAAEATPTGKSSNKHTKKPDIIKMKNRLWKMGLE